jgi:glycosyltransferase involved in cell wall biosynthesis
MRICYLSKNLISHDYRFLSKLVDRGYETFLVTYSPHELPPEISRINNLNIIHRKLPWTQRISSLFLWTQVFDFRYILKKIKVDILHSGFIWHDGLLAALSGFHPHLSMPWGSDILEHADKFAFARIITRFVLKHADMVTCDAQIVKRKIIEITGYQPKKIIVFPWGLELNKFNPNVARSDIREKLGWQDNKVLVMNRLFRPIYGISYFINALPAVIREVPETRVVLIGKGRSEMEIKELVKHKGLTKYVSFIGWVPLELMPKYLRAADVYVSSSLSDGTSMSLLEAMACRMPVVVSDVPAILEWVSDGYNGFIVPRGNSEVLADRLIKILKNSSIRQLFSDRNLKIAKEKADWEKNFDILEEIYRELYIR